MALIRYVTAIMALMLLAGTARAAMPQEVTVTDSAWFKDAFENPATVSIILGNSIVLNTGTYERPSPAEPLSVDGKGYTLTLNDVRLNMDASVLSTIHNITLDGDKQGKDLAGLTVDSVTGGIGAGTVFKDVWNVRTSGQALGGALRVVTSFAGGITGATFEGNRATSINGQASGGAVQVNGDFKNGVRTGTVFRNNEATGYDGASGGALLAGDLYRNTSFEGGITGAIFEGNRATSTNGKASGGAVHVFTDFKGGIHNGTEFRNNRATGAGTAYGGALFISENFEGDITGALFEGNKATAANGDAEGGAVFVTQSFNGINAGTVFRNNVAEAGGTGYAYGGALRSFYLVGEIAGATFEGNRATAMNHIAFGGAVAVTSSSTGAVISGSTFRNNQAVGANALGGALFIATGGTADLTLGSGAGQTTLFQGNTANGLANAIHFGRATGYPSQGGATLLVAPSSGGIVALYDPISVDINDGKTFAMTIGGAGDFLWGGRNDLAAHGGARVDLRSGSRTMLLPDFQLTNLGNRFTVGDEGVGTTNRGILAVTFDAGHSLAVDLTGRPAGDVLPFFFRGNDALTDTFTLNGTATIDKVAALTFDAVDDKWLLADSAEVAGLTADSFTIASGSSLFTASVLEENGKYYLAFNNDGVMASVRDSANPNTAAAYEADLFSGIWDAYLEDTGKYATFDTKEALFTDIVRNPQTYLGESALSFAAFALTLQTAAVTGALAHESASRDRYAQAAASDDAFASLRAIGRLPVRFWGGYLGGKERQQASGGLYGYKSRYNGGSVGLSYDWSECVNTGVYFSHAIGRSRSAALQSDSKTTADTVGLFVSISPAANWRLDLDAAHSWYDNDSRRRNLSGTYTADYDQKAFTVGGQLAYDADLAHFRLSPFLGVRYQHLKQDACREQGGFFAFRTDAVKANSFATRLGVTASREYAFANGRSVTPELTAAWRHEFGDRRISASGGFVNAPQTYRLHGAERGRDAAELGVAVRAVLLRTDRVSLETEASYELDIRDNYVGQNWYAGLGLRF